MIRFCEEYVGCLVEPKYSFSMQKTPRLFINNNSIDSSGFIKNNECFIYLGNVLKEPDLFAKFLTSKGIYYRFVGDERVGKKFLIQEFLNEFEIIEQ